MRWAVAAGAGAGLGDLGLPRGTIRAIGRRAAGAAADIRDARGLCGAGGAGGRVAGGAEPGPGARPRRGWRTDELRRPAKLGRPGCTRPPPRVRPPAPNGRARLGAPLHLAGLQRLCQACHRTSFSSFSSLCPGLAGAHRAAIRARKQVDG